jgi:hypothetical protein
LPSFEDAVRPFQLPQSSPSQLYQSQYNVTAQPFVMLTPGFGGDAGGGLPPIITGSASFSFKVTYYMDQAANELSDINAVEG